MSGGRGILSLRFNQDQGKYENSFSLKIYEITESCLKFPKV